MSTKKLN